MNSIGEVLGKAIGLLVVVVACQFGGRGWLVKTLGLGGATRWT
jgi:hypothetical protein